MSMTLQEFTIISEKIRKGAYTNLKYSKTLKTYKDIGDVITKEVSCVVRLNIDYLNLKETKEKGISESNGLAWGEMVNKSLIKHKGKYYARLYQSNLPNHRPKVTYYINGKPTTKEAIIDKVLKSEIGNHTASQVRNINLDNIISIG